ncbi:helix-turn-helix domain-containing protein [Salipaludibacillus agaradhaerens]|nr:helix-turn-helix domain-containing protein [Salipaludibacillus agaradhaerens]MCR6120509.1 helix-turn-helix domain-containing protein [Salipaludibacillus agaradhaerens]
MAKLAGVSPTTVFKIMNNYSAISHETKEKVTRVIAETGYISQLFSMLLS